MADHLDRWDKDWKGKGLRVVQVELGRIGGQTVTPREELEAWMAERRTEHPVLYDATGAVTERFGVSAFPTALLVDRNGRIVWQGFPAGDAAGVERRLRKALGL